MSNDLSLSTIVEGEIKQMLDSTADKIMEEAKEYRAKGQALHSYLLSTKGLSSLWSNIETVSQDIVEIKKGEELLKKELEEMEINGWNNYSAPADIDILESLNEGNKTDYEKYIEKKAELEYTKRNKISLIKTHTDLLNKAGYKETMSPTSKNTINFFGLGDVSNKNSNRKMPSFKSDEEDRKPIDISEDIGLDIIE